MSIYIREPIAENLELEYENIKDKIKKGKYKTLAEIETDYPDNFKIQSALIRRYIKDHRYDKAIAICEKYPEYDVIQSQRVTIHINNQEYNEAIKICNQFTNCSELQSQLATIYIKLKRYDDAIEICDRHIDGDRFKMQKAKAYIKQNRLKDAQAVCKKYPCCILLQELDQKISKIVINNELEQMINQTETQEVNSTLYEIRSKLADNTIQTEDLAHIQQLESKINENIYKFILIAIYHKLGMKKTALQVLKSVDSEYSQYKGILYNILSSKKTTLYDLGIYDQIINWYNDNDKMFENQITMIKK